MNLNRESYRDKVYACWVGKNIGGTMGTPYEGKREMNDIKGFATEANVVLPNDDLDLQLVWLQAVEKTGIAGLNAERLGEFWLSYITPYWNEYGIGKTNMTQGIQPPISGESFNNWKHSNGAWIRTEIWATLAPGAPDIAMKYAYEDACVDHGTGEGTVAAMFVAAIESAAFVVNDLNRLLDIGLSKIPETSRLAQSIRTVRKCYADGMDYREAREVIRAQNADIGDGWFEAPSNVTYAVLGLLWGKCDFKKSMIYAINCGDDTDCTAATVGSILGIMDGTKAIPEDWRTHIGDAIVTTSIAHCRIRSPQPPKTCTELTDRVLAQVDGVLLVNKTGVTVTDAPDEIPDDIGDSILADDKDAKALCSRKPYTFESTFAYAKALVTLEGEPRIAPEGRFKIHVRFENQTKPYCNMPYVLRFRWLLPEGFRVEGPRSAILPAIDAHSPDAVVEADFTIVAPAEVGAVNRIVLEALADGRFTAGYLPVTLLG